MMKMKKLTITLLTCLMAMVGQAQGMDSLVIGEVVVKGTIPSYKQTS